MRVWLVARGSLCLASGAWLRANELLLSLIAPADLPDPSRDYRPQVPCRPCL